MNLTSSGFDDMALIIDNKDTIKAMNEYFDSLYKKALLKPKYFYIQPVDGIFPLGKYKGLSVKEVQKIDPKYIDWAKTNLSEDLKKSLGI